MTNKLRVRKGDNVIIITGKDAGKQGKILSSDPKHGKVAVEKANMVKRHTKPTKASPQGGIMAKEALIDASNVMMFCGSCKKAVRVSKKLEKDGSYSRVCAKCGESFDK
ncbi:MAG: 50S ribosomal protein L24 [Clostridia bacterium]|nr:50S ribosomal protein L24 [Clostridia bacterium]